MPDQSPDSIHRVAVIGAGTMGGGIAHVAALAGYSVALYDVTADLAAAGLAKIRANLDAGVLKGKVAPGDRDR
ncbi:MAG TPA: 3-hydroxyacyl-CoA dehydrogenase NAD-binding domain-containing protein, partial [Verrucomicrobiae bacterium]|nr:3-hydroxyacyl-CoA dehydrogenase NAD-binding domain-containing protein [Verrucomicrobiae bacterium]